MAFRIHQANVIMSVKSLDTNKNKSLAHILTQVRYLQSSKDAVVLGADVGATAEGGHRDGVAVQHWQVVAVPTV